MKRLLYIVLLLLPMLATSCGKGTKVTSANETSVADKVTVTKYDGGLRIHLMDRPAPVDTLDVGITKDILNNCLYYENSLHDEGIFYSFDSRSRVVACHSPLPEEMPWTDHPFFDGVRYAYANHHPLVVNPDVMWLLVERGFALHVKHNAEQLRDRLVNHEGKMPLRLLCEPGLINMPYDQWEPYFPQFTEQMVAHSKDSIVELLLADFSTTTPTTLVASQISTMSILQSYFAYEMEESCGIPDIYLEGTAKDWRHLLEKVQALRKFDLDWWIDDLVPIFTKIAESAEGNVDAEFWRSIYKTVPAITEEEVAQLFGYKLDTMTEAQRKEMMEEYFSAGCATPPASEKISGWITAFYPYHDDYYLFHETKTWRLNRDSITDEVMSDVPCERTLVPVKYVDLEENELNLVLHAGLFSFVEDPDTRAIRVLVAWMATRPKTEDDVERELIELQQELERRPGMEFFGFKDSICSADSVAHVYWHGHTWDVYGEPGNPEFKAVARGSNKELFDSLYFEIYDAVHLLPVNRHGPPVYYSYTWNTPNAGAGRFLRKLVLTYDAPEELTGIKVETIYK